MNFYTKFEEGFVFEMEEEGSEEEYVPGKEANSILLRIANADSPEDCENSIKQLLFADVSNKQRKNIKNKVLSHFNREIGNSRYLCRLLAYLNFHNRDIVKKVVMESIQDFCEMMETGSIGSVEKKVAKAKLVAEMVKFGLVDVSEVSRLLSKILDNFNGNSVEMLCVLLEHCGRFLYLIPSFNDKMKNVIRKVRQKAISQFVHDERVVSRVNNALLTCNPEVFQTKKKAKNYTEEEEFLIFLLENLKRERLDKTAELLRKFDWSLCFPKIVKHFYKFLTEGKIDNIALGTLLMVELKDYHYELVEEVLCFLLEEVRIALQRNDFNNNQRAVLVCQVVASMFKHRLIKGSAIIELVYLILSFNPQWNVGKREITADNPLDSPSDMVRISMVLAVLNTGGKFLRKEKLLTILNFLQLYILQKQYLSLEMENRVVQCISQLEVNSEMKGESIELQDDFFGALRKMNLFEEIEVEEKREEPVKPSIEEKFDVDSELDKIMKESIFTASTSVQNTLINPLKETKKLKAGEKKRIILKKDNIISVKNINI